MVNKSDENQGPWGLNFKPNNRGTVIIYWGGSVYTLLLLVVIAPNLGNKNINWNMFWELTNSDKQGHTVDGNQKSCDHLLSSVVYPIIYKVLFTSKP